MTSHDFQAEDRRIQPLRYEGLDLFRVFAGLSVVLLHVYATIGLDTKSNLLIRLRDCAVPFFILSSIFILTNVLIRKPELSFRDFFYKRFKRLWLPFFIWTIIYTLILSLVLPLVFGWNRLDFPTPTALLTRAFSGYMHLWFLQFLFVASLFVYPVAYYVRQKKNSRWKIACLCLAAAVLLGFLFNLIQSYNALQLLDESDQSLLIFVNEGITHSFLIPIGIILSLYYEKIDNLYKRPVFRVLGMLFLLAAMIIYVESDYNPYLRWLYSLAVFGVAIQPWKPMHKILSWLASYSYAIYIVHVLPVYLFVIALRYEKSEVGTGFLLVMSLVIYLLSFLLVRLLRQLFPYEWFLPLVAVNHKSNRKKVSDD